MCDIMGDIMGMSCHARTRGVIMLKREKLTADLCVVGGGMAGICTAIAAAREGIKVLLVPETLCRKFELTVESEPGEEESFRYKDNVKRAYHFDIGRHNRLEHMRPMLVKFPLSRSFGICKATSLASPCKNI